MRISGPTYDFTTTNANNAPEKPGVYVLYQDGNPILVGSASDPGVTLRSCLQAHVKGDLGKATRGATAFQAEVTESPAVAAYKEQTLLWDYQYVNGRPIRCNDSLLM